MTNIRKRTAVVGLVIAAVTSAACTDFLAVDNPGSVPSRDLVDSTYANLLVNGAIGEFQSMISSSALWGGVLSDELQALHANTSYGPIDLRDFNNLNDIVAGVYSPIQRSRFDADTVADRLKGYPGATPATDLRVARMLALAGYSYVTLGETFCSAPVNGGAARTPAELFGMALPRFDEAIQIATAATAAGAGSAASADSILNLARVGAARAALDLNDRAKALGYAQAVPAEFQFVSFYSEGIPPQPGVPVNPFWNATGSPELARTGYNTNVSGDFNYSNSSAWIAVEPYFENLGDPRVTHTPTQVKLMRSGSMAYIPNKPKSFGGYVAPTAEQPGGVAITPGASIRVASGLEAEYIVAEAQGGSAETRAFVDAQRAANGLGPSTAGSPEEVLADLRDQKRREFYLDGHRLGELRRYAEFNGVDMFTRSENHGTVTCFPIPLSELNSNPAAGG
ncbi:MAG: hypothetical protein ACYC2G_05695 [Gemmatimonadaceae bacterium]